MALVAALPAWAGDLIFEDGFESGDVAAWSSVEPPPDSSGPTFQVVAPIFDAVWGPQVDIWIDYQDPSGLDLETVVVTLNGTPFLLSPCEVSFRRVTCRTRALQPGIYTVGIKARDRLGNLGELNWPFEVLTDTLAPELALSGDGERYLNRTVDIVFGYFDVGTGLDLESLQVTLDGEDITDVRLYSRNASVSIWRPRMAIISCW